MKKILKLAAIVCAAALFVSCGAKDDATQVKEVMESYLKASVSFDYGKIKSLVTAESVPMIEEAEKYSKDIPEEFKKAMEESAKSMTFNPESVTINGEVATASISAAGMDMPVTLKKVDGKWLIDMAAAAPAVDVEEPVDTTAVDSTAVDTTVTE